MNKPTDPKPATEKPAPPDPRLAELNDLLLALMAQNELKTLHWGGSNAQFIATRTYLAGQREALHAIAGFVRGDRSGVQKLLEP